MKKSSLLSLLTAGAILVTTAGTYAVWDTVTSKSNGSLTVASPSVVVTGTDMATFTNDDALGNTQIAYTSTAKFNVTGITDGKVDTMTLTPTVTAKDTTPLTAGTDYDITIKKGGTALTSADGKFVDTALGDTDGEISYTVIVTVKNKDLATKILDVSVEGTVSKAAA